MCDSVVNLSLVTGSPVTLSDSGVCGSVVNLSPVTGSPVTPSDSGVCGSVANLSLVTGSPVTLSDSGVCGSVVSLSPVTGSPVTLSVSSHLEAVLCVITESALDESMLAAVSAAAVEATGELLDANVTRRGADVAFEDRRGMCMEVVEAAEVRGAEVVEGVEVRGVEVVEAVEVSWVEVVEAMEGSGVEVSCTTSAGKAEGKIRFKMQGRTDGEKQHPPKKTS